MISVKPIVKHFPNAITLFNLISGCLSIVASFEGRLELAGVFILLAALFDFLDGFTARLIGAYTLLGKELDSLSDVVSFGVAPSMIFFQLLKMSMGLESGLGLTSGHVVLAIPFIMAAFSALRLGIFNLDERQTSSFIGLPTPANAIFTVGLVIGVNSQWGDVFKYIVSSPWVIIGMVTVQSFLLVCELPMFSLKIKSVKFSVAYKQYTLIAGVIILFILFGKAAISLVILWYLVLSFIYWVLGSIAGKNLK